MRGRPVGGPEPDPRAVLRAWSPLLAGLILFVGGPLGVAVNLPLAVYRGLGTGPGTAAGVGVLLASGGLLLAAAAWFAPARPVRIAALALVAGSLVAAVAALLL